MQSLARETPQTPSQVTSSVLPSEVSLERWRKVPSPRNSSVACHGPWRDCQVLAVKVLVSAASSSTGAAVSLAASTSAADTGLCIRLRRATAFERAFEAISKLG